MRKKLSMLLGAMILSCSIIACDSADSGVEKIAGDEGTTIVAEGSTEAIEQNVEADGVSSGEGETEESVQQEKTESVWYMDAEGIKNDSLNMFIRKDNGIVNETVLVMDGMVPVSDNSSAGCYISCSYYEGDMDIWIAEHGDMERGEIDGVSYAYKDEVFSRKLFLVGNGIAVEIDASVEEGNAEELINKINLSKLSEESGQDYLAYVTPEGMYCPALGIEITMGNVWENGSIGVEGRHADYTPSLMGSRGLDLNIKNKKNTGLGFGYHIEGTGDAQEVINKSVEEIIAEQQKMKEEFGEMVKEYVAIEEGISAELGSHTFFGKGIDQGTTELYLLCSDTTDWVIAINTEEGNIENYLSIIENLE